MHFFDVLFLLPKLFTGPSFMSISSLVLELWQFSFIRDWPKNSEIPRSEFCPIPGDWDGLGIPYLARMSLMKCYLMLQNTRVTAFTLSELLRENQRRGEGGKSSPHPTPTQIWVKNCSRATRFTKSIIKNLLFMNFTH